MFCRFLFQVRLEKINDKLWRNLYWTATLTRPDRLAKILNLIIRKESDDSENFIYNRQAVKYAMKNNLTSSLDQQDHQAHLTYYEKLLLGQIDQQFDSHNLNTTPIEKERSANTRSNNNGSDRSTININNSNTRKVIKDTNEEHILSREEVDEFLRELSGDVYLDDETIKPRPINVRFIKIEKLSTNMKLFSSTILVRMQSNVYKLPVRCKPTGNNKSEKSKSCPIDRIDRIENLVMNLTNQVKMDMLHNI
jgi:hypothetical protein